MSKFICKVCGEKEPCVLEMVNDQDGFRPMCCPVDNQSGINADWHEVTTHCSQLPKLTVEVFDRPDCPAWAKWVAVDMDGIACYFSDKPTILPNETFWARRNQNVLVSLRERYDATDWRNSPIERPAKLPDWCKVGEWVYSPCDGGCYCKITDIDGDRIFTRSGGDAICFHIKPGDNFSSLRLSQARLRPYNEEEMKALMGKVIKKGPSMHIVTGVETVFDNECMVHVNGCLYGANDLFGKFTIDGSPCGKLEHLENGEWVE